MAVTLDYFTRLQIFTHDVRRSLFRRWTGDDNIHKGQDASSRVCSLLESDTAQFPDTGHILSSVKNVTYYNTANIIIRELTKQVDLHVSCVYTLLLLTMGDALTKQ